MLQLHNLPFRPAMAGALLSILSLTLPAPPTSALQAGCPIASVDLVGSTVGQPVTVDELMISNIGPRDECMFESPEGIVLVGRVAGFFASAGSDAMGAENLLQLTRTSQELMFTPEAGVGDAASWAEAADPAIRAERLAVLIVRRGSDAFFFGVDHAAFQDSRRLTIALAAAVIAANP